MNPLTPWAADAIDQIRHQAKERASRDIGRSLLEDAANETDDRTCSGCGYVACDCRPKQWDALSLEYWDYHSIHKGVVFEYLEYVEDDPMTGEDLATYLSDQADCERSADYYSTRRSDELDAAADAIAEELRK